VQRFIRSDPYSFIRAFDALERSLFRIAEMEGGRVVELESVEKK
jgi:hypothetical protein